MHFRNYRSLVLKDQTSTWDRVSDHRQRNFSLLCDVISVLKPPVEGSLMYEKVKFWITAGSSREDIETVSMDHLLLSQVMLNAKGVESEKQCWHNREKELGQNFSANVGHRSAWNIRDIISHGLHPAMARAAWLCILSINKQDTSEISGSVIKLCS